MTAAAVTDTRQIVLDPAGSAQLVVRRTIPANGEHGARERIIDTKTAPIAALFEQPRVPLCLPPHCRFVERAGYYTVFVIEDAPQVRTVMWHPWDELRKRALARPALRAGESVEEHTRRVTAQETFRLALPYIVRLYVFSGDAFQRVFCYFRNEPLRSHRDELLRPNLPNVYPLNSGHPYRCCLKLEGIALTASGRETFASIIEHIEAYTWGSAWNKDLWDFFLDVAKRVPELETPWHWEAATREDPTFVLRVPWNPAEGTTIGAAMARAINRGAIGQTTFAALEERIRTAETWGAAAAAAASADERASPTQFLALETGELAIGDSLALEADIWQHDGAHAIEWFGYATESGVRHVKLAGIGDPLPLIVHHRLAHGARLEARGAEALVIGGVPLTHGALLTFPATPAWAHIGAGTRMVASASRDADGRIFVRVEGSYATFAVGQHDALDEGITLRPPEEVDGRGYLRAERVTLPDGTAIAVGDAFFVTSGERCSLSRIAAFSPLRASQNFRRAVLVEGSVAETLIEGPGGQLASECTPAPRESITAVDVDGVTIRIGDRLRRSGEGSRTVEAFSPVCGNRRRYTKLGGIGWACLTDPEGRLTAGTVLVLPLVIEDAGRTLRFGPTTFVAGAVLDRARGTVHQIARYSVPGDGVAVGFDERGEPVQFVSDWKCVATTQPVWLRHELGDVLLARGDRLRLAAKVPGHEEHEEFIVSCIVPPECDGAAPVVLFEDGTGFDLVYGNASTFERWDGEHFAPLPGVADVYPAVSVAQGPIAVGVRVRYLGGDTGTEFFRLRDERAAQQTPATVVRLHTAPDYWEVRFDECIPGAHDRMGRGDGNHYQYIHGSYLQPLGPRLVAAHGLVDVVHGNKPRCVQHGLFVGYNRAGAAIRIGDRVRITGSDSGTKTARASELVRAGHVFTVVHSHVVASGMLWVWLDAGEDVGQSIRSGCEPSFYNGLPAELRSDPAWWRRLCWATVSDCTPAA